MFIIINYVVVSGGKAKKTQKKYEETDYKMTYHRTSLLPSKTLLNYHQPIQAWVKFERDKSKS